jgi:hypothetical protein
LLFLIASGMTSAAQTSSLACQSLAVSRVTTDIDDSARATLHGNLHSLALPKYDQGQVDDSLLMEHMILMLKRTPEQEQALTTRIDQMHNASAPLYHQWLRAADVGNCYGVADADIAAVTGWLEQHGFQVDDVPAGKMLIMFTGTAGNVREAFQTEIHNLNVNGEQHIANMSEPTIPTALAPVIAGFRALHNFFPKSLTHVDGPVQRDPETGKWKLVQAGPKPEITYPTQTSTDVYLVGPQDLYTIYNENPLLTATTPINGAGQTLAIIQDSDVVPADVTAFRSQFGLPAYPATPSATQGGVNYTFGIKAGNYCGDPGLVPQGGETEADIDVEWIGATAPAATIDFVSCADTATTFGGDLSGPYIVNNLDSTVSALSLSFGWCESGVQSVSGEPNSFYVNLWKQAVAEGQTPVVAAGDSGDNTCDRSNGLGPDGNAVSVSGLSVSGMSSTPYNISTGGTMFTDGYQNGTATASPYWNTNETSPYGSALSYIPETAWNDDCGNPLVGYALMAWDGVPASDISPEYVCNHIALNGKFVFTDMNGGSGGISTVSALPTWQSAYGVGLSSNYTSTTMRNQPDVSLFAADVNGPDGQAPFWLRGLAFCQSDVAPCTFSKAGDGYALAGGGTSFVAPMVTGIIGLINQASSSGNPAQPTRQGQANYTLYALATEEYGTPANENTSTTGPSNYTCEGSNVNAISTYGSIFPNCTFYSINRTSQVSYNTCLGSNNANCIVGGNDMPCETGSTNCYTATKGDPDGLLSLSTTTFEPGYPNSAGFNDATGLGSFNIANLVTNWTKVTPQFASATAATANPTSLTSGTGTTTLTATVVATGRGGIAPPLGTVSFYKGTACTGTALGTANLVPDTTCNSKTCGSNSVATLSSITGNQLGNGTDSVVACFSGDGANDAPSTSPAVTITVAGATISTTTGLTLSTSAIGVGSTTPITLTATVTPSSGSGTPTGTITFWQGTSQLGQPVTLSSGSATYSYNASSLAKGSYPFSAIYSGDTNYSGSTSSPVNLTVAALASTTTALTLSPTSVVAGSSSPVTLSATVAPASGSGTPTGTVTFFNGTTQLNQATLASGAATYSYNASSLAVGSYPITATYSGDTTYAGSTAAPVNLTVAALASTTTALTVTPNSITAGSSSAVALAAKVTQTSGSGTPTGTVTFFNGTTQLNQATLASGTATYSYNASSLASGSYSITATYGGDTANAGSTSAPATLTVTPVVVTPGFTVTGSTVALNPGATTANISTITVTPSGGFTGNVTLTASIATSPSGAQDSPTLSFGTTNPVDITSASAGTATLTISTTAATSSGLVHPKRPGIPWYAAGGATLACILFIGIPARRRNWLTMFGALLVLLVSFGGILACGGGSGGGNGGGGGGTGNSGTTAGTYTLTITGTSGTITNTGTVTLTVQ